MDVDRELNTIFRVEVAEQIDDLEEKLRHDPARWKVDRVYQITHNIKGAARIVGADGVRDAASALEDLVSAVRGGLELDPPVVEAVRNCAEILRASFAALEESADPSTEGGMVRVGPPAGRADGHWGDGGARAEKQSDSVVVDGTLPRGRARLEGLRGGDGGGREVRGLPGAVVELARGLVPHVFRLEDYGRCARQLEGRLAAFLERNPTFESDPDLGWAVRSSRELARSLADHLTDALRDSEALQLIASSPEAGQGVGSPMVRRHRLLLVDDSATSRKLMRDILTVAHYDVMVAVNGEAALRDLTAGRFDLVISDVEMPGLNGFELTREIRRNPHLESLPVILVTSLGGEDDRQEGSESGADAYLVKGEFDQDELLRTVEWLL